MQYYSEYTITLQELIEKEGVDIFDFDEDVNIPDSVNYEELKSRFINKYYMREIGFETYSMWKFKFKEMWKNRISFYGQIFDKYRNIDPRLDYSRTLEELLDKDIDFKEDSKAKIIGVAKGNSVSLERNTPLTAYDESDYISFKGNGETDSNTNQDSEADTGRKTKENNVRKTTIKDLTQNELEALNKYVNGLIDIVERFLNEFIVLFMRIY